MGIASKKKINAWLSTEITTSHDVAVYFLKIYRAGYKKK